MEFLNQLYSFYRGIQFDRVGDSVFIILLAVGCYYLLQGKQEVLKKAVIFPCLFYTIFVMNSFTMKILYEKLGFETRGYRFMWMYPILLLIAYLGVRLLYGIEAGRKRWFFAFFLILVTYVTMNTENATYRTENIYKVQDELLETTKLIHEQGDEEPWVYYEDANLYLTSRQYDPSIKILYYQDAVTEPLSRAKKEGSSWDNQEYHDWITNLGLRYLVVNQDTTVLEGGQFFKLIAETEKSRIYQVK